MDNKKIIERLQVIHKKLNNFIDNDDNYHSRSGIQTVTRNAEKELLRLHSKLADFFLTYGDDLFRILNGRERDAGNNKHPMKLLGGK